MRPQGRPLPAPFAVAAAARPLPRGHAAAAARSRAALALVLLVSAAALFVVVAAARGGSGGSGAPGIGLDAATTTASSSMPSIRTSVGTRSVSGAADEKSDKGSSGAEAATEEEAGEQSKKSSAPPPPPPPPPPVSVFFARPVRELRHDGSAFTQGLEFDRICSGPHAASEGGGGGCRDVLWESTGQETFFLSFFLRLSPSPCLPLSASFHSLSLPSIF